tara:strand:- start:847 stop:2337 length:1491 start_codon:yes stop_codon:yes gene_type:complete
MPLIPLEIPPGVVKNGTALQVAGRWFDSNLIRWRDNVMMPVGGWLKMNTSAITGICRGLISFRDNGNANKFICAGTNSKLYVWNDSGTIYDITPSGFTTGRTDAIYGLGYGTGNYGASTYGTARAGSGQVLDAATWSLDTWGEYLVGVAPHYGRIVEWQLNTGSVAANVSNAPYPSLGVLVTPERHLMALGAASNNRKVAWSDQEDNTVWAAGATNTAGAIELETTGTIRAGVRVRGEILIVTDVDAHVMTYLGPPLIYNRQKLGSACGLVGPNAIATAEGFAVWMGKDDFHVYDGTVRSLPCDVRDFVFGDINLVQGSKIYAGVNSEFDEIWFFYPTAASDENDRYVCWNYKENYWSIGSLSRTAWVDSGAFTDPTATDASGFLYSQESGWTNAGAALTTTRYVETGGVSVAQGDNIVRGRQVISDEAVTGQAQIKFKTRFTPNGSETEHGPYTLENYTDVRFSGRQFAMRIEGRVDDDWRVGTLRLDAKTGGRR